MLVGFLAALAAAVVFLTFVQTLSAYPGLPAQCPMHLDVRGRACGTGPRAMAFLIPGIQLFIMGTMIFSGYAIATGAPGAHGSLLGLTIIAVSVAVLTWRVQMLLIESAKSGGKPVAMRGFWMFFAVWMCVVLADAFLIG